jgi:hypothetical protein
MLLALASTPQLRNIGVIFRGNGCVFVGRAFLYLPSLSRGLLALLRLALGVSSSFRSHIMACFSILSLHPILPLSHRLACSFWGLPCLSSPTTSILGLPVIVVVGSIFRQFRHLEIDDEFDERKELKGG